MEDIENTRVLITGGAGFIGSTLAKRLIEKNEVIVFDTFQRNALGKLLFTDHGNLTIMRGDVLDMQAVRQAMHGVSIVIHCAGIAGRDTVVSSPTRTLEVNIVGSLNVLRAALESGACERIVCFSTSEVFGRTAFEPLESDIARIGPLGEARWVYAVSKLAEEHSAIWYHKEYGLPTTVIRPFNIYGPGQVGEGAIHIFVKRAIRDLTLYVHGSGTQIRSWCYVDDIVDSTCLLITRPEAVGESFNIGNAQSVETVYGLATTVVRVLRSNSSICFSERSGADVELRIPSVEKAKTLLGFEAKVGLEEGIVMTANFYRNFL